MLQMSAKKQLHKVLLSVGCNIDAAVKISFAVELLKKAFPVVRVSSLYESEAVGVSGNNFLNIVVGIETELNIPDLFKFVRNVESQAGRDRSEGILASFGLDIDILTYDDCVGEFDGLRLPRKNFENFAYVLLPLSELEPDLLHPKLNKTYLQLWREFDKRDQRIWLVK